jgi:hypothetical protein
LNIEYVNSVKIAEIINLIFKPLPVSRDIKIQFYETFGRPTLAYGYESWTIRRTDQGRLPRAEMCS